MQVYHEAETQDRILSTRSEIRNKSEIRTQNAQNLQGQQVLSMAFFLEFVGFGAQSLILRPD